MPPKVTWSHFVSCHKYDSSGAFRFIAEVDLVGSESWTPTMSNLKVQSNDRYRLTLDYIANGGPPPERDVEWSYVMVNDYANGRQNIVVSFPSKWAIREHCPN